MITITIDETDKDGRLLGRYMASAPIDRSDAKGVGTLRARSVGGLMYQGPTRAEVPLLLAAAGTHHSSRCTQAIAHAVGLAGNEHSFEYAVKPVVDLDRLLDYRTSKKDREHAAHMLKIMGAAVKTKAEGE
jgi:hypothetical protein